LRRRQEGVSAEITAVAWKAQNRLHRRYMKLMAAGKDQRKIITAIGRELMGFIWAIGIKAEAACNNKWRHERKLKRQKQKLSNKGKQRQTNR
jgi:hypothetical protein